MTVTVTTTGFAALEARMQSLSNDVATKIGQAANRAGAVVIAKKIKETAPIGPDAEGSTRNRKRKNGTVVQEAHTKIVNNIKVRKVRAESGKVVNAIVVGRDAYHASMVEFGSIHNAPNPFFRTGFALASEDAVDRVKAILDRRLTKAGV